MRHWLVEWRTSLEFPWEERVVVARSAFGASSLVCMDLWGFGGSVVALRVRMVREPERVDGAIPAAGQ